MSLAREKFSTQVASETLRQVREIAQAEGRMLQSIVDEALADVVQKHKHQRGVQPHAIAAYRTSHGPLGALYRKLAE
jgi:predicted transcriptional regulator